MKRILSTALLSYFRLLARIQLWKISPQVIGITGTAGKTSALHAIDAVLKDHFVTKPSHKANSESGLPLNILGLSARTFSPGEWLLLALKALLQLVTNWDDYDFYIAEMGIDSPHAPKNMGYLLTFLRPEVGVLLNVRPMHSLEFDSVIGLVKNDIERKQKITQAIANEKGKLITQLPQTGAAILNIDDPVVYAFAKKTAAPTLSFGTSPKATVQFIKISQALSGTTITLRYKKQTQVVSLLGFVLPSHFGYTCAAAVAVGLHCGVTFQAACRSLEKNFSPPPGRASLIPGISGSTILDSSYNSSAQPALDMLELLKTIAPGRKLALLGDIRELGKVEKLEHELVARHAAKICNEVVLVGPLMQRYALPVIKKHKTPVRWFARATQAAEYFKSILKPKDTLLVKGSQNTLLLEIAVEHLMAHPENAEKLLCRRGEFWEREREKLKKYKA